MSDIKVGDKVYLNPESKYADKFGQLPLGVPAKVLKIQQDFWVVVTWDVVGWVADYPIEDLTKVELKLKEYTPLPIYKVGQNVTPRLVDGEILTGCGVIISVEESKYNVLYEVLTDFGNVVTLTEGKFHKQYEVNSEDVIDIEERIQIQMDKLTNVWIKLKNGDYNEQ